jgi:DNA repair exonuclease SbcCD ATPase subunit
MSGQPLGSNISIESPYAQSTQPDLLPHMLLRKQNCMSELNPAPISIQVAPSSRHLAPTMASVSAGQHVQQIKGQIYPTQSQAQPQQAHAHEADWSKHAIVTSVAGLETKLAELDQEIRTTALPDSSVMRHIQDHATVLRKNAQQTDSIHKKQREITNVTHQICSHMNDQLGSQAIALEEHQDTVARLQEKQRKMTDVTHQICSQMNDQLGSHATALEEHQDTVAKLQQRQSNTASLAHEICSSLNDNLESHGAAIEGMERKLNEHGMHIAQMKKKDEIEHALLSKILTLIDKHDTQLQDGPSGDHHVLLDAMCQALEKTKGKMQSFEKTQNEMQRILADFQQGKLAPSAQASDTHTIKARLDKYSELSKQMDRQFSHMLSSQQSKIKELEQRMNLMSPGDHSSQLSKIRELEEKIHKLSLQQLNTSQSASIARTTDRDLKLLQHDMKQVHALKQDVQTIRDKHESAHRDMHQLKADVHALADATKRSNVKSDVSDLQSKLQDLRREVMMHDVRMDKTHMQIMDLQKSK